MRRSCGERTSLLSVRQEQNVEPFPPQGEKGESAYRLATCAAHHF